MFNEDSDDYLFPSISDCIYMVGEVKKRLAVKSNEYLVNVLIEFETKKNIELPDDISEAIDNFFAGPKFTYGEREKLEGFIVLLECDLMVSEEGEILRTIIR